MGPRSWELRKFGGCKGNQDFLGKVYFFKTKLVVSGMVVSEPSRPLKNWIPISNVHCPQRTKMRTGIVTKNNIKTIIHILRLRAPQFNFFKIFSIKISPTCNWYFVPFLFLAIRLRWWWERSNCESNVDEKDVYIWIWVWELDVRTLWLRDFSFSNFDFWLCQRMMKLKLKF